jgi:hypothetical protein
MKMISDGAVSSREITTNLNSRINRRELLLFQPCGKSVKLGRQGTVTESGFSLRTFANLRPRLMSLVGLL